MSDSAKHLPNGTDPRELVHLLSDLRDAVRLLPHGAERIAALPQVRDFQTRLSAILLR